MLPKCGKASAPLDGRLPNEITPATTAVQTGQLEMIMEPKEPEYVSPPVYYTVLPCNLYFLIFFRKIKDELILQLFKPQ